MKRGGGMHTVPAARGAGWWNKVSGRVASRHRLKVEAVAAGRAVRSCWSTQRHQWRSDAGAEAQGK